ncbi:hypothetical protein C8J56DRAFT_767258 [Mycena floridula]|nr:hypothetical protein C8J56DRAFT_767258 [Mycena floridula]
MDSRQQEEHIAALGLLHLVDSPINQRSNPLKRKLADETPFNSRQQEEHIVIDDWGAAIQCICGFSHDDGFSIGCDGCDRWCHSACFNITRENVPNEWLCWKCSPRPVDKENAARVQREQLRQSQLQQMETDRSRRRTSPGVERKQRKSSAQAEKRKRRNSIVDDNVEDPWNQEYLRITEDSIPDQQIRDKLRRQAQQWRGVSAISPLNPVELPSPEPPAPQTSVHQLPDSCFSHPTLSLGVNPEVRPPSYALHTTTSIPSEHLIAPYKSTITPSSTYLSNPLNAYAHIGMPKTFVHLMGPPLDVTLDARMEGNEGRFVRSGCRPNAVLRPVICSSSQETLSFGVFALRDLKADEEVVLGWEWDDGNAVHNLPAIISTPNMFP